MPHLYFDHKKEQNYMPHIFLSTFLPPAYELDPIKADPETIAKAINLNIFPKSGTSGKH
jgi:hypothetical protein